MMPKKPALAKSRYAYKETTQWQVLDTFITVEIVRELRRSSTYRFSNDKLLVRLPMLDPDQERLVIQYTGN